jgi:inhibitor of KinA
VFLLKIVPAGDQAVLVEFENEISEKTNSAVTSLANGIRRAGTAGVKELVPTYRSLLILYDPLRTTCGALTDALRVLSEAGTDKKAGTRTVLYVPCCYGGEYGEDLAGLSALKGISEEEIIAIHSAPEYKIYMLGFLPGFTYLGGMDPRIAAPRLETPRVVIPAGSVGIGGSQTGVYPIDSPGGWRLIGKTPLRFYDPDREEPILCRAGEYIRFVSIGEADFKKIESDVKAGSYHPQIETEEES